MSFNADFVCSCGIAAAIHEMEFGAPFAMLVVPSIGSSAISKRVVPGSHEPSCSPLKIPGALSLIPSPITTCALMSMLSNIPRIASHAAASASSFSPRPSHCSAFNAAFSQARTKSNSSRRSMPSYCSESGLMCVGSVRELPGEKQQAESDDMESQHDASGPSDWRIRPEFVLLVPPREPIESAQQCGVVQAVKNVVFCRSVPKSH